jgi:protein-disulfide isomerase
MNPCRRRPLLLAATAAALVPAGAARAQAPAPTDPRLAERSTGSPEAPVAVQEFFSLTCGHCAAFHRETWPQVKKDLVDTGQVRMIWRDFPLDRVGLIGAMVARSLPPERYEGFVGTLLANQDRWAFTRDPVEELGKLAALAGMGRAQFEAVTKDEALARGILELRQTAERQYTIQATPTFVFQSGRSAPVTHSGNMPFDRFAERVQEAKRA